MMLKKPWYRIDFNERMQMFRDAQRIVRSDEFYYYKNLLFKTDEKKFQKKKREKIDVYLENKIEDHHLIDVIEDEINLLDIKEEYEISIHNKIYNFKRVYNSGCTSYYYTYKNIYFMKVPRDYDMLLKEIYLLKKLERYPYFPKLVQTSNKYIIMNYCGEGITRQNLPNNSIQQVQEICDILNREKINHTDIKREEVLVQNGIITLVDFGYARLDGRIDCGLMIKVGPSDNDYRNDREVMMDVIEREGNPVQFYEKNKYLKNYKNQKWYNWKWK